MFVIDCLFLDDVHGTHLNFAQAMDVVKQVRPKKTYLTGMSHEFDYAVHNRALRDQIQRECGLDVEMAFDGLRLDCHETSGYMDALSG
jgi:phosphoribosyl 1,2-cyclic phosphodiesterase